MWNLGDTLWHYRGGSWAPGAPIAAFDFDSTLHKYRGRGPDMKLGIALLVTLKRAGRNVVIFSNRSTASARGIAPLKNFVELLEEAGGSCDVYAAVSNDRNRKPQTGAWDKFLQDRDISMSPVLQAASFYCGDAAGREGDFAGSDRNFAHNIGLPFLVPEQLYGAHNVAKGKPAGVPGDPVAAPDNKLDAELALAATTERRDSRRRVMREASQYQVVLMMGSPASGKSSFAREFAERYRFKITGRDMDGASSCSKLRNHLIQGERVVVDNTHGRVAARDKSVWATQNLPGGHNVQIAIVWLKTPKQVCEHLDGLRCDLDKEGGTPLLPRPVIPVYWKNLEPPNGKLEERIPVLELEFALAENAPKEAAEKRYA